MPKGMFSQGVCLLTDGKTSIEDVKKALEERGHTIVNEVPAAETWQISGPSVVISFRPEVNGAIVIDVVDQPWPDDMGDPQTDPTLFGAWSMGQFGPFTYPGGLSRAKQQAWTWEEGPEVASKHRGFVRLRTTYVSGSEGSAPVLPEDYDAIGELIFLSEAVTALANVPGVLCYFNPSGELLCELGEFQSILKTCMDEMMLPLLLWMNIRLYNISDTMAFMDTVGNDQIDIDDVEAIFPLEEYEPAKIDYYLRNVSHYLIDADELTSGESIDGPEEGGESWSLEVLDESLVLPPRKVVRLYPKSHASEVRQALKDASGNK